MMVYYSVVVFDKQGSTTEKGEPGDQVSFLAYTEGMTPYSQYIQAIV